MKSIGITDFINRKFDSFPFEGKFKASFGEPERNSQWIIYGASGNGKTDFAMKLAKYMAQFTRVYYNTFEEGISKTMQDAIIRNNMQEVAGRVVFGDRENLADMMERLSKKGSPMVVIIDSRDFINLTTDQYKKLTKTYPRKCFITICWEQAGKPRGVYAKDIEYMCDIKIRVAHFKALPRSRFGGNEQFVIWDRKPVVGEQLPLAIQ